MKAYHVYDPWVPEDELLCAGLVVYAETRGKAKALYVKRIPHANYCVLRTKRLPDMDGLQ